MKKDDSGLEKLQSTLDSRTGELPHAERKVLHDVPNDIPLSWDTKELERPMARPTQKKKGGVLGTLFVASLLFFVIAAVASAFFFLKGGQTISAGNIRMDILGPTTIGGGDELVLQLAIGNENPVAMRTTDLVVEFPEGTRAPQNENKELPRLRESLGDIESGEVVNKTVRALLFGEEGTQKTLKISLEYRVDGSNAFFSKEQEYTVTLNASPVSLEVSAPSEATSGQNVTFTVVVTSNSQTPLKNLLLVAEYPFGFTYKTGNQAPKYGDNIWAIGDLPAGGKRTIVFSGQLSGEDGDERFFRYSVGTESKQNEKQLAVAYVVKPVSLKIEKPFLSADLSIDGSSPSTAVIKAGKVVRADIQWSNNLPNQLLDGEIRVKISGAALDRSSVTVDRGFYRSGDNTIVWNGQTDSEFLSIDSGARGRVGFTFNTQGASSGQAIQNPEITLEVSVSGRRVGETGAPENIESSSKQVLRVGTDLLLGTRITRTTGPFSNTGPLPPRAEQETTYTVTWNVINSSNTVENVDVRATLPPYVRFLGTVSPSGEDVTFAPVGGTVVWHIGTLESTPQGSAGKEVSFQIGFTPSITQVGTSPILMNEQSVTGTDQFTNSPVGSNRQALTTRLLSDPGVPVEHGVVVK